MCFLQVFSPVCVVILLKLSFTEWKFLNLMKTSPFISFTDHTFSVVLKRSLLYSRSSRFSPMLYSRIFMILCFMYGLVMYFELAFVKSLSYIARFIFACGCPFVPAPFVEETVFSPLYYLCSFVKDQLTILTGLYFWALFSVPLICLFIFLPVPHCVEYHSFIVNLEIG